MDTVEKLVHFDDLAFLASDTADSRSESDQSSSTVISEPIKKRKCAEISQGEPRVVPRTTRAQWRKLTSNSSDSNSGTAAQISKCEISNSNELTNSLDETSTEGQGRKLSSKRRRIAKKPSHRAATTVVAVKEAPFIYDKVLLSLPEAERHLYDKYAIQSLIVSTICDVKLFENKETTVDDVVAHVFKVIREDLMNKYKLSMRHKNGRVDCTIIA
jgi:hypothetical protein